MKKIINFMIGFILTSFSGYATSLMIMIMNPILAFILGFLIWLVLISIYSYYHHDKEEIMTKYNKLTKIEKILGYLSLLLWFFAGFVLTVDIAFVLFFFLISILFEIISQIIKTVREGK